MTVKIHTYTHIFNFFVQELNEYEQKLLKSTKEIPSAISLFRKNSYPTWEDKSNINGFNV